MKTTNEILHDCTGMLAENHPSIIQAMEEYAAQSGVTREKVIEVLKNNVHLLSDDSYTYGIDESDFNDIASSLVPEEKISDEDIEKYMDSISPNINDGGFTDAIRKGFKGGAKAMQSGTISEWVKNNH
jgi:hypothetical protein